MLTKREPLTLIQVIVKLFGFQIKVDVSADILRHKNDQNLRECLLKLYPREGDMVILLSERMGVNWYAIAKGNSYNERLFHLLQDLDSQGKKYELIGAVKADKPNSEISSYL